MAGMAPHVVAEEAGVGLEYVDRLRELGILVPDTNGDFPVGSTQRVRIVQMLSALERRMGP